MQQPRLLPRAGRELEAVSETIYPSVALWPLFVLHQRRDVASNERGDLGSASDWASNGKTLTSTPKPCVLDAPNHRP